MSFSRDLAPPRSTTSAAANTATVRCWKQYRYASRLAGGRCNPSTWNRTVWEITSGGSAIFHISRNTTRAGSRDTTYRRSFAKSLNSMWNDGETNARRRQKKCPWYLDQCARLRRGGRQHSVRREGKTRVCRLRRGRSRVDDRRA